MRKTIIFVNSLILIVALSACGATAPAVPQATRGEQITQTGLFEIHTLSSDPSEIILACDAAPVPAEASVTLKWLDGAGKEWSTEVACSKIERSFDATPSVAQIKFVFDQVWLDGAPKHVTGSGGEEDLSDILRGELGMYQNAAVDFDGVNTNYKATVLVDPNNFLLRGDLTKVIITLP